MKIGNNALVEFKSSLGFVSILETKPEPGINLREGVTDFVFINILSRLAKEQLR